MIENVAEFGFHNCVKIFASILLSINAAPRRAHHTAVCLEGLYIKDILIINFQHIWTFSVHCQIVFQHANFFRIPIIDYELLEIPSKLDRQTTDSTKWLKHSFRPIILETLTQILRDRLSNYRIPAFPVDLDPIIKHRKQEISQTKVFLQILINPIDLSHFFRPRMKGATVEIRIVNFNERLLQIKLISDWDQLLNRMAAHIINIYSLHFLLLQYIDSNFLQHGQI